MPEPDPQLPEHDLVEIVALADGRLAPERADALRARLETEPVLAAEFDRQQRAISLVRNAVADVEAPFALRERIENQRAKAPAAKARGRRRWFLPAAAASALGVTAAALVIALGAGAPSV
ncbi:MAG: anti-sigma factor, partial [Baekduiaceae bacterium]